MTHERLPTQFAPAERASETEVRQQSLSFLEGPLSSRVLDSVNDIVLVLNKERQVVFANRALLDFLEMKEMDSVCGLRPGEVLDCVHSFEGEGGCGTTEFCSTCGAVRAILASQEGKEDVQECRITRRRDGEALELLVRAVPFHADSKSLTFFSATDISHEKRRRALERIFFHDILNTAGGLRGFAELLMNAEQNESREYKEMVYQLTDRLIEEIMAQKELTAAEHNELSVHPYFIGSIQLLREIVTLYRNHDVAGGRQLLIDPAVQDVSFVSDETLLRRVIGNMVKNALEAANPGETVTLGCESQGEKVRFWVHNPNCMSNDTRLQIFNRSFSTKGVGRGLGTYSIKLLTERYLQGKVSFTTSPEHGTTFTATYPLTLNVSG